MLLTRNKAAYIKLNVLLTRINMDFLYAGKKVDIFNTSRPS